MCNCRSVCVYFWSRLCELRTSSVGLSAKFLLQTHTFFFFFFLCAEQLTRSKCRKWGSAPNHHQAVTSIFKYEKLQRIVWYFVFMLSHKFRLVAMRVGDTCCNNTSNNSNNDKSIIIVHTKLNDYMEWRILPMDQWSAQHVTASQPIHQRNV